MEPTIYPFFKGKCLEAMSHYAEVLGGEIGPVFRNGDAPIPTVACQVATTWSLT